MIRITFVLALFVCNFSWAQPHVTAKNLQSIQSDSCFLSVYLVATKEMVKSEDEVTENLLERREIANIDLKKLLEKASRKSSYQDERAMLTHYNIRIDLYREGTLYGNLKLSSLTGNITFHEPMTKHRSDGNVSQKFGEYLIQFLDNYEMLTLLQSSGIQGFTKDFE